MKQNYFNYLVKEYGFGVLFAVSVVTIVLGIGYANAKHNTSKTESLRQMCLDDGRSAYECEIAARYAAECGTPSLPMLTEN